MAYMMSFLCEPPLLYHFSTINVSDNATTADNLQSIKWAQMNQIESIKAVPTMASTTICFFKYVFVFLLNI